MFPAKPTGHSWKFFRTGGLDQVALENGADLLALEHLDPKLWVALSCPVKGIELDEKTLALVDTDGDGHIRVPEVVGAVQWAAARLADPGDLLKGVDGLPLAAISQANADGRLVQASARQILRNLGRPDAVAITVAEATDTARIFTASALNGDGVIPPEATDDAAVQALIKDIIACRGGAKDLTGATGVTAPDIDAFFADLSAYLEWIGRSSAKDIAVLGEATAAAVTALRAIRAKAEDYFARCRLAAFDARAVAALNRDEKEYVALAAHELKITADEVAGFPLAHVEAGRPLPLLEGVNPAWAPAMATMHAAVITPVFGAAKSSLTEAEWNELNAKFAAYETWLGGKAGSRVEQLGVKRLREIDGGDGRAALAALVAKDKALEPEYKAVHDVERLARYHRDLRALLHNFVNFADFYSPDRLATFQAGTLYLDSRSTELCVRVDGPSPLAAASMAYIAYCACARAGGMACSSIGGGATGTRRSRALSTIRSASGRRSGRPTRNSSAWWRSRWRSAPRRPRRRRARSSPRRRSTPPTWTRPSRPPDRKRSMSARWRRWAWRWAPSAARSAPSPPASRSWPSGSCRWSCLASSSSSRCRRWRSRG